MAQSPGYKTKEFEEFAQGATESILRGETMLTPESVMALLKINKRQLQDLYQGNSPRGLRLQVYRLGKKTLRFALSDVVKLQWDALHQE